jgi:hypothetical protein
MSREARDLRRAITDAIDPVELLGEGIPQALGVPSPFDDRRGPKFTNYERRFESAIQEIHGSYQDLLRDIRSSLAKAVGTDDEVGAIRSWFQSISPDVIKGLWEPDVRAFLEKRAADEFLEVQPWIESVGTALVGQQPRFWMDHHLEEFRDRIAVIQLALRDATRRTFARQRINNPGTGSLRRLIVERPEGDQEFIVGHKESGQMFYESATMIVDDIKQRFPDLNEQERQSLIIQLLELLIDPTGGEKHD